MNLAGIHQLITDSHAWDWKVIDRNGPIYRNWLSPVRYDQTESIELTSQHHTQAVYHADVDLTISYGMILQDEVDPHSHPWTKPFADSKISAVELVDIFWRGSLVDRYCYASVDGFGAILPIGIGEGGLKIFEIERSLARLLDELSGHRQFDTYYGRVPYEIQD